MREEIAYRHRNAVTIQRYTRGWLVRKRVSYFIQVNRALQKMTKELADVQEAYEHLPQFQGKGFANVRTILPSFFKLNYLHRDIASLATR